MLRVPSLHRGSGSVGVMSRIFHTVSSYTDSRLEYLEGSLSEFTDPPKRHRGYQNSSRRFSIGVAKEGPTLLALEVL